MLDVIEEGCDLNFVHEGYAVVHKLCHVYTTNRELLLLLLEYGANPDVQDKRGDTLAHYAAEENDVELLKLLKSKGANFDIVNRCGKTALDCTAMHYVFNKEAYEYLLQFVTTNVVEKIVLAVKHQDLDALTECLNSLKDSGKLLNTEIEEHGLIGHVACGIGNLRIIKLLEKYVCDLSLTSSDNTTALEEACYGDNADLNPDTRIELISYLIDIIQVPITNRIVHNSLYCEDIAIPRLLLDKGGDPDALGVCDFTPLLVLINQPRVRTKTLEVIKLLLDYEADILMNEGHVGNSLHLAAERGHMEVGRLLIGHAEQNGLSDNLLQPSPAECWVCKDMDAYQIALSYKNYKFVQMVSEYFDILENSVKRAKVDGNASDIIVFAQELLLDGEIDVVLVGEGA